MEFQKYAGVSSLAQSLQTGFGDILDYKADMARTAAIASGAGNVYRDTILFQQGKYNPYTGELLDPNAKSKFGGLRRIQNYKK